MINNNNIKTLYRSNSNELLITAIPINELSGNNYIEARVNNTDISKLSGSKSIELLRYNRRSRASRKLLYRNL